jgi:hypothetical protein
MQLMIEKDPSEYHILCSFTLEAIGAMNPNKQAQILSEGAEFWLGWTLILQNCDIVIFANIYLIFFPGWLEGSLHC